LMEQLVLLFQDNQENTFILFGLMFMAGLLSVATPCVYPMLPITSMFIVNRANGVATKEKQHALVYLVGIIGTYMLLGLMAGLSGGAFNSLMQSAWINIAFALFFAFFALALLGFYELGFMQNEVHTLDQHSARVKGLTGTWLMGCVAGLVISPCVGPIVFALLLQVADKIAAKADALALLHQQLGFWDKLGISAQGSVMMAGFGLGVGLPFFLISVLKFKKLPKAGYWMNKVKYGFGFVILYFAYTYLEKGLGVLGVEHHTTLILVAGMLGVWIAIVHCNVLTLLPENASPNQKMQHYCGAMSILVGGWLIVASLGQIPLINTVQANAARTAQACPDTNNTAGAPAVEKEAGISWHRNYAAAQKLAQQTGKPIFIDFYASWCANCVAFKAETANNSELNRVLREKAIAVKLVDKESDFETFRESAQHRQLKIGLPYFAILTADGQLSWSGTDYKAAQKIVAELTKLAG
jgi:thioredoxin:protein disulfide reductase